jgi:tRNA-(ms[2]io[6]A)-hydroxylase
MVSEAGHYKLFLDLAYTIGGKDRTEKRWEEWLTYEADVMKQLELRGDRVH